MVGFYIAKKLIRRFQKKRQHNLIYSSVGVDRWKNVQGIPTPCNQGTKIGIPKVFRRIPKNSSTNISRVPRNSDSYQPNTLAIRERVAKFSSSFLWEFYSQAIKFCHKIFILQLKDLITLKSAQLKFSSAPTSSTQ